MVRTTFLVHLAPSAAAAALAIAGAARGQGPPGGFKVAFFGDQGLGSDSRAVLQLVLDEGAEAIVHLGDFDYDDNPAAWYAQMQDVLPPCFPVFAVAGNHDESEFGGYQAYIQAMLECAGVQWHGSAGDQYSFTYGGVYFVLTTPDLLGGGDAAYVASRLATPEAQAAVWRVSGWHVLMEAMQIGGKSDESGWEVYENSRLGGAIVATGHEHSYERSKLLSDMSEQTVVGEDLVVSEGQTFAFVSGLGGQGIRDQERCFPTTPPYGCSGEWASVYAEQQGANFGALFIEFGHGGDPRLAHAYFKDIDGNVPDEFFVRSAVGQAACPCDLNGDSVVDAADKQQVIDDWGCRGSCSGDVTGNLRVDMRDLLAVLAAWGACPGSGLAVSAPKEPSPGDAMARVRDPFSVADDLLRERLVAPAAPAQAEAPRAQPAPRAGSHEPGQRLADRLKKLRRERGGGGGSASGSAFSSRVTHRAPKRPSLPSPGAAPGGPRALPAGPGRRVDPSVTGPGGATPRNGATEPPPQPSGKEL